MVIKKLNPVYDKDWELFYQLLQRVRVACREGLSNLEENKLVAWLKLRFVNDNNLYLFVLLENEEIIGHLIGWIEFEFDKPIFFIHQAKSDVNLRNNVINIWESMKKMLPTEVQSIRFWTKRKGFERYLQKLNVSVKNKYNLIEV